MMSQKITPHFIAFLLLPLFILGCSLFQSATLKTGEEWTSNSTELFTINLPSNYLGAQPGTDDIKVISDWMRNNGYDSDGFEAFMESKSSGMLFTAYNTQIGKSGGLTQMTLAGDKKSSDFVLEQYVDFYMGLITGNRYKLISHKQRTIGDKQVDVILYNETVGDFIFTDGVYIFETDNRFWKFEFFASQDDFKNQEHEFERIVSEFETLDGK